jgi:hypothetical protein
LESVVHGGNDSTAEAVMVSLPPPLLPLAVEPPITVPSQSPPPPLPRLKKATSGFGLRFPNIVDAVLYASGGGNSGERGEFGDGGDGGSGGGDMVNFGQFDVGATSANPGGGASGSRSRQLRIVILFCTPISLPVRLLVMRCDGSGKTGEACMSSSNILSH